MAPQWRDLPTSEYSFDPQTCHFRILVPPRTSLRLTRELTYVGPSPDAVDFPLGELHVKGGDDLLSLTDPKEIQYLFEKRRDTLYEFNLPHS